MRILLDTVAFWWFANGSSQLTKTAIEVFESYDNEIYLSSVSIWELVVKHTSGKLQSNRTIKRVIDEFRLHYQITALPFVESAALKLYTLPSIHRDPFDRMLICQALHAGLTLLTPDKLIQAYPVPTLW